MALIIEPQKQDTALQNVQAAAGLVSSIAGSFKKAGSDAKADARADTKIGLEVKADARAEDKHKVEMDEVAEQKEHDQGVKALQQQRIDSGEGHAWRKNPTDADFNPEWTTSEQILNIINIKNDAEFQKTDALITKQDAEIRHTAIMKHGKAAQVARSAAPGKEDWNEAFKQYDEAYTLHRDGADVVIDDNQLGYTLTDSFGKVTRQTFESREDLAAFFDDQLTAIAEPDDYLTKVAADKAALAQENAFDLSESGFYTITSGEKKGWTAQVHKRRNLYGKNKRVEKAIVYDANNKFVKEYEMEEFKTLGMSPIDVAVKQATIAKTEAQAGSAKAAGLASAKESQSKEYILAQNLAKAVPEYLINAGGDRKQAEAEAMRHVMAIKSARDLNSAREYATKVMGTDFSNKDESAEFMKLYNETHSSLPERKTQHNVKATGLNAGQGGDADKAQSEPKRITKENTSQAKKANIKKRTEELLKQGKTVDQIYQMISDEQHN
jgi:hypothetical protein